MKPGLSILDRDFEYVPSVATSVAETWQRFGWRPASKRDDTTTEHCSAAAAGYDIKKLAKQYEAEQRRALLRYFSTLK